MAVKVIQFLRDEFAHFSLAANVHDRTRYMQERCYFEIILAQEELLKNRWLEELRGLAEVILIQKSNLASS